MKNSEHKVQAQLEILDVTLRDGEQTSGVSFSLEEKLNIAKFLLLNLKVNRVEVASARVSDGELETVRTIINWARTENLQNRIEMLGFVDQGKTVDWISEAGGTRLNLLTKGSLHHLEKQLRKTPDEHVQDIKETIEYATQKGIETSVYLEDWSNGFRHSPEYVKFLIQSLSKLNVQRFYLADTLGVLDPDEVFQGVQNALQIYPQGHFEFHGHNDYDLAVANCLAAVKAGVKGLHVSVNGLGERAGNSPLEAVVTALHDKMNVLTSIVEKEITAASRLVETFSGKRISGNRPVVGADVFTQTAGVHADGDKKGNLYANPILPERFGRTREYALGKLAGKASISENLKQLGMVLSPEMEKKVLDRVIALGDQNKIVTQADLPFIIADVSGNSLDKVFEIKECKVFSGIGISPRAELTIRIQGKEYQATGEGDGGYDAFMRALQTILQTLGLELPPLEDYEVRIPPGGKTDALVETVITWFVNGRQSPLRTTGVDSDQTVAAIQATEKMLNMILRKS